MVKKASRSSPDAKVRRLLAQRKDSGETPRHTLFYFYDGDLEGLRKAAICKGSQVHPTVAKPGLMLKRTTAVDERIFDQHAQRLEAWAEQFNCDFDGWECQLVIQ